MTPLNSTCLNHVKTEVAQLLSDDHSGHGIDHIKRVVRLTQRFAQVEHANAELATIIALLHDVDDYKLFGAKHAADFDNATRIMADCKIDPSTQQQVLAALHAIGYLKRLQGIKPETLEAQIVSDADMCDGLGVSGILRTHAYQLAHHHEFFDRNNFPIENLTAKQYLSNPTETGINHIFEKVLKLKDLMLTSAGRAEATSRHQFVVDFLRQFFTEENAPEWLAYLDQYLSRLDQPE